MGGSQPSAIRSSVPLSLISTGRSITTGPSLNSLLPSRCRGHCSMSGSDACSADPRSATSPSGACTLPSNSWSRPTSERRSSLTGSDTTPKRRSAVRSSVSTDFRHDHGESPETCSANPNRREFGRWTPGQISCRRPRQRAATKRGRLSRDTPQHPRTGVLHSSRRPSPCVLHVPVLAHQSKATPCPKS